jgi:lysozyme
MSDKPSIAESCAQALAIVRPVAAAFEGMHKRLPGGLIAPYLCPAGVPTIGRGATHYEDGKRVSMSDAPITEAQAEQLFDWMLPKYQAAALAASPGLVLWPKRLAAITDFVFNCGGPRYRASTLRRKVDAGEWDAAAQEMRKWVRGGGVILPGLVRRREMTARLLL